LEEEAEAEVEDGLEAVPHLGANLHSEAALHLEVVRQIGAVQHLEAAVATMETRMPDLRILGLLANTEHTLQICR